MTRQQPGEARPRARLVADALDGAVTEGNEMFVNHRRAIIMIDRDRAELIVQKHLQGIQARMQWTVRAGLFLSFLLAMATSSFRDFVLPAHIWELLFAGATAVSAFWLLEGILQGRKAPSLGSMVQDMVAGTTRYDVELDEQGHKVLVENPEHPTVGADRSE